MRYFQLGGAAFGQAAFEPLGPMGRPNVSHGNAGGREFIQEGRGGGAPSVPVPVPTRETIRSPAPRALTTLTMMPPDVLGPLPWVSEP